MPTGVYQRQPKPLADPLPRFWAFVEQFPKRPAACWIWTGKTDKGYGKFWYQGRNVTASRFTYEQYVGPIPAGLKVCHHCDTPACVRPSHLFVGTTKANTTDAIRKGRFDPTLLKHARKATGPANCQTKLTADHVRAIRAEYRRGTAPRSTTTSLRGLATRYGVTKYAIFSIIHGLTWRHLGDSVIV
jgi:hypothetical protein